MSKLHLDLETYSSEDIKKSGAYRYCASIDFEILLAGYAFDNDPITIVDLAQGETWPPEVLKALKDPKVKKYAHNAAFERVALAAAGIHTDISAWRCTATMSAYAGLPLSLEDVSKALELGEKGKLATGKRLIKYFCCPVKPTKVNGGRVRNFPFHDLEKWEEFKTYCVYDVEAEREIVHRLEPYPVPASEWELYELDQKINDRGVLMDETLARAAIAIDLKNSDILKEKMVQLTGLKNPNSPAQLAPWLSDALQKEVNSIAKDALIELQKEAGGGLVGEVIDLRLRLSKTSIKKYIAAINCKGDDGRIRGLFKFYGATRTGRWAGRLVQLQNLKRNYLEDLDTARKLVKDGDLENMGLVYDNVQDVLSQLIRTVLVASPRRTLAVSDFSAIEARVLAWLASEHWRLEVFNSHGKIYEASAALMFGVPVESIGKGSDLRAKGKIAELALGYQGALGALRQMGGADMGLSDDEMLAIVKKWRAKNPNIKKFWGALEMAAVSAVANQKPVKLHSFRGLVFDCDGTVLTIQLPSGRKLYYREPRLSEGNYPGKMVVKYKGIDQNTRKWSYIKTYGGKLAENITQAVARDLLAVTMLRLDLNGFNMVMHVHDEIAAEVPDLTAEKDLQRIEDMMGKPVTWAPGLPLTADGYLTKYYKKD